MENRFYRFSRDFVVRRANILDISDYLRVLRRHWVLITTFTLLGLGAAAVSSMAIKPTYTAKTQLFVAIQNAGTVSELQQGNTFSQARVQSYVETVASPVVLQPVIDDLGLEATPAELSKKVSATSDSNTVIISINASDSSPVQASAIAQAVGESLIAVIDDIERTGDGDASPVRLSVITPASAPVSPAAPNTRLNLILGALAGLAVGLGFALLRSKMDTKVIGEQDIRRITDSPILGGVAYDVDATKKPLLTQAPPQSPRAESFRQIRTNMQFAHVSHESKAILVTSSLPGEGKSTTATNLAIAMAQGGQTVVLVDADLRRPRIDDYLGLEGGAGLTTALIGSADVNELLQPWGEDQLFVLTSGQIPPNPSELLGSEAMRELIQRLEDAFDAVIIDAPPLLPVTDAAVLAQQVGGVVLVVGSGRVREHELAKSLDALTMVDADLLGVILNLVPTKGPDAYAYSYYTYQPETRPSRSRKTPPPMGNSVTKADNGGDATLARARAVARRETLT